MCIRDRIYQKNEERIIRAGVRLRGKAGEHMKKTISIGKQSFSSLREHDNFFVDKTNFIKEWWEKEDDITLIARPRRFGKSLLLSTLEAYFKGRRTNFRKYYY